MPHTPGPWTVETVPTQVGLCHKIGPFPGSCGKPVGYACVYVDGASAYRPQLGKHEELLANAVLMAAAPEMLVACVAAYRMMSNEGENDLDLWQAAMELLESAIAKATK